MQRIASAGCRLVHDRRQRPAGYSARAILATSSARSRPADAKSSSTPAATRSATESRPRRMSSSPTSMNLEDSPPALPLKTHAAVIDVRANASGKGHRARSSLSMRPAKAEHASVTKTAVVMEHPPPDIHVKSTVSGRRHGRRDHRRATSAACRSTNARLATSFSIDLLKRNAAR